MKKYSLVSRILSCTLIVLAIAFFPASIHFNHAMAAALTSVRTIPTSNIVTTKASYEILFTTATTGTIKTVTMAFPKGFNGVSISLIERSGIGAGLLSASGTTIIYTVTSPVSIPAGIPIRFELSNMIHPGTPGAYSIFITTKDSLGNTIDGPTAGTSSVVQIGTAAIANNAVTTAKIGSGQVSSLNLAGGAVTNPIIARNSINSTQIQSGAVGASQIAPGAVTSTTVEEFSPAFTVTNHNINQATALCPPGSMPTGGGWELNNVPGLSVVQSELQFNAFNIPNGWFVSVVNPSNIDSANNFVIAICTTLHP